MKTSEFANRRKVEEQTVRAALCRDGHYLGISPIKRRNRFLEWPDEAVEHLEADEREGVAK